MLAARAEHARGPEVVREEAVPGLDFGSRAS